jgi:anti-sigma factor RsiW
MAINPCKDESVLNALADGELPPEESGIVVSHLESCPQCRQRFDAIKHADEAIKGMAGIEPSAGFDRVFWRKVADLENRKKSRFRLGALLAGWRPLLATGVAAAIAVAILIYTGQNKKMTQDEALIAQNMELLQDYDLIDQLDMLENWDDIQTVKEPS